MLGEGWRAEEPVVRDFMVGGVTLRVQGRADAVRRTEGRVQVMEIKTTARHPKSIGIGDFPEHLAQGQIYAYLFCENEGFGEAEVTLVYYRLDGAENRYRRTYSRRRAALRLPEVRAALCRMGGRAGRVEGAVRADAEGAEVSVPGLSRRAEGDGPGRLSRHARRRADAD